MKNGIKVYNLVKDLLENSNKCRIDDMFLYKAYVVGCLYEFDIQSQDKIFVSAFSDKEIRLAYDIRTFESISRARRKVQQDYPELAVDKTVRARYNKTSDYIDFNNGINSNLS